MIVEIYITVEEGGDRPYVSTTPPTEARADALRARGVRLYRAKVYLPDQVKFQEAGEYLAEPA